MYGSLDPAVLDACRHTARGVTAARARDDYLGACEASIVEALRRPLVSPVTPNWAYATTAPVPVGHDFAAWVAERGYADIAACMFDAAARMRLLDQYVQARAEADTIAAERAGRDWLEVAA